MPELYFRNSEDYLKACARFHNAWSTKSYHQLETAISVAKQEAQMILPAVIKHNVTSCTLPAYEDVNGQLALL